MHEYTVSGYQDREFLELWILNNYADILIPSQFDRLLKLWEAQEINSMTLPIDELIQGANLKGENSQELLKLLSILALAVSGRWNKANQQTSTLPGSTIVFSLLRSYLAIKVGRLEEGLKIARRIHRHFSDPIGAYLEGFALAKLGGYQEATIAFDTYDLFVCQTNGSKKSIVDIWLKRIPLLIETGNAQYLTIAKITCRLVLKIQPQNVDAWLYLAECFTNRLPILNEAIESVPKSVNLRNDRAVLYGQKRQYDLMRTDFEISLNIDYENEFTWFLMGEQLTYAKPAYTAIMHEAVMCFNRAIMFNKHLDISRCNLWKAIATSNANNQRCAACKTKLAILANRWSVFKIPLRIAIAEPFELEGLMSSQTKSDITHPNLLSTNPVEPKFKKGIDSCIEAGTGYNGEVKLIVNTLRVENFSINEWVYIAVQLKYREAWINQAFCKYTIFKRFNIYHRWQPDSTQLVVYEITRNRFKPHTLRMELRHWITDKKDAQKLLKFAKEEYDYYVRMTEYRQSDNEWLPGPTRSNMNRLDAMRSMSA